MAKNTEAKNKVAAFVAQNSDESGSEDGAGDWVGDFCSQRGNEYFVRVDMDFVTDRFNLTGIGHEVPNAQPAYDIITDDYQLVSSDDEEDENAVSAELQYSAKLLYGLIHARYIISPPGLARMRRKFLRGDFGTCPRVLCKGQALIAVGLSDVPRRSTVNLYCCHCEDIYNPKSASHSAIDGAYFGTTFPHLFFQTYSDLLPIKANDVYVPKIFGFRIAHPDALKNLKALRDRQDKKNNINVFK